MANPIVQTTSAGATVATDVGPSGEGFQLIKLVDGSASATTPVIATSGTPAAGTYGLVVAVKPGVSVVASVTGSVSLSGTPAITGSVAVSGTATITGAVTISGTAAVTLAQTSVVAQLSGTPAVTLAQTSVVAQVSGSVTLLNGASVTIQNGVSVTIQQGASVSIQNGASVSFPAVSGVVASSVPATSVALGVPMWIVGGQTATGVPVMVTVTSTAQVTLVPGASISTLGGTLPVTGTIQNVASVSTILGTVAVTGTIQNVASVSTVLGTVAVTGTVNQINTVVTILSTIQVNVVAGAAGGGSVTTAAPSVSATGQVMWVAGGQSTTASPVYVSQINPPAGGGGSVTTAAPSVSATGQMMWVVGGQSTTAFPVVITGTVAGIAGVVVTTTGSAPTATATGLQMWLVGGQTATGVPVMVTVTSTALASIVPGASISAVGTLSGTVAVSQVAGVSISSIAPVTTAASVSVSGLPVWLNPTQQVVVSGLVGHSITGSVNIVSTATVVVANAVSLSSIVPVTTAASVSVSGLPVWLNPTQNVVIGNAASLTTVSGTVTVNTGTVNVATGTVNVATGTISVLDVGRTQVAILVTATAYSGGTTMAFSICQGGSQLVAGTTSWTIPAGKIFRVLNVQMVAQNSVVTTPCDHEMRVLVSNALPTWTSTAAFVAGVMVNAASQTISYSACAVGIADVTAGSTIAIGYSNNTSGTLVRAFINGYLFQ